MSARPRVRVQSSAHGQELIVDETFASLQRSDGAATHCVWDAIAAPALAIEGRRAPRVLLLGYGGGSAARIVRALHPQARIVGVEVDPDVVAAAREHFDVDALGVELHTGDARAFLRRAHVRARRRAAERYDLILEDVFVGRGDLVRKPDWIPHPAHDQARACLRPGGVLVANTIDEAGRIQAALRTAFRHLVRIEVEDYDNRIFAASDAPLSARDLRARLAASPVLRDSLPVLSLRTLPTAARPLSARRRGTAAPRR